MNLALFLTGTGVKYESRDCLVSRKGLEIVLSQAKALHMMPEQYNWTRYSDKNLQKKPRRKSTRDSDEDTNRRTVISELAGGKIYRKIL